MNKSQLFKAAHKLAKSVIQKGDSYRVTFGLAIKAILSQAATKSIADKLIAAGGKVWEKAGLSRIYLSQEIVEKCELGIRFNDKKHKLFFDLITNQFSGTSDTFVKVLNAQI
ncbi:hypothetical protein A9Z61_04265 [Moraxella osloensis]|jgi:hypothetical protein|nr:hypothetical protein [Moraxella osloensis]OBX58542.1 hypothetical protein A9Z61_04265 [Moraxella osloensis]